MSEDVALSVERRLPWLALVSIVLFVGLTLRLGQLQIGRHGYYAAVAESQRQRASELAPNRGAIYLSEGIGEASSSAFPVATNKRAWFAYAVPRDMDNPEFVADIVAPQLYRFRERQRERSEAVILATGQARPEPEEAVEEGEEEAATPTPSPTPLTAEEEIAQIREQLYTKFNQKTDPYEPLMRPYEIVDEELRAFIEEHSEELRGIVLEEIEVRTYPEDTLAAHVLGFVGYEDVGRVGRYGVEGFFEEDLAGHLGFLATEQDTTGAFIGVGEREFEPAQDGADVVLTIDRVVQSFIEEELARGVELFEAERGSIIVMHPRTGAILGMATYPTFDPNQYYAIEDPRTQTNPVVSDQFEPGSILKPVVMAAAIEEGIVEPDTTMVDNGPVKVDKFTIDTFDGKHHGVQTMTQILEQSNNIGMVWVGQQMGAETMYDYFRRFGLGERTGIRLEGETNTHVAEPDDWNVATIATTSFGQGIATTPLQALNSVNALANKGVLVRPHVVKEIRESDGERKQTQITEVRRVVSAETADKLSAMMVSVIENGVAGLARVPGYFLAGKTGTAQVPDEHGAYSPDRKIISFVGYGPVEDPQFSILVKLDNPAGLSFASGTAAPMFQNVAERLLRYYQIPPAYDPAGRPIGVPPLGPTT